jgi:CRISPR-associated protein Csb3
MNRRCEAAIRVRVDPTNPGQFFACCGLLELADRLWDGAEGWFEKTGRGFSMRPLRPATAIDASPLALRIAVAQCPLTNTMTEAELQRREQLSSMRTELEGNQSLQSEKKTLDSLWREAPVVLGEPFDLRLDWFADPRAGGDDLKTWAGQQSVIDIATGMHKSVSNGLWQESSPQEWLFDRLSTDCLPFNFDSDLGGVGGDRDVGFSFDPLKSIKVQTRPLIELLAFFGLQRFRPARVGNENRYRFSLWSDPMMVETASPAACGHLASASLQTFEFRLLYRTKYLKSFLPAIPISRS